MNIKFLIKILVWLPVIAMCFVIFGFSKQSGEQSGGLSHRIAESVLSVADDLNLVQVTDDNREGYIEALQFPIRKGAHMSEYAILAIFVFIAIFVDVPVWKAYVFGPLIFVFLFACSDEFHQLFVPDRTGKFTDVLIDFVGGLIGLLICKIIKKIYTRRHRNCICN